MKVVVFM